MLNSSEIEILKFLFFFQYTNKPLMRVTGCSYDYIGRTISSLIKKGFAEEIILNSPYKQKALTITKSGLTELYKYYHYDKKILTTLKNKTKGDENKYRQYKFAITSQILYPYFPDIGKDYITTLQNKIKGKKISTEKFIENNLLKKQNAFIPLKHLREVDEYKLRKLTSTRAQGIAKFGETFYTVYNFNKRRMRSHGDFEEKFKDYILMTTHHEVSKSLNFGAGYQLVLDTFFKTSIKQSGTYILTKGLYTNQYFIPLTSTGSKQLQIYFIPEFRQKIRSLLLPDDVVCKIEQPYDGFDSTGNLIYIGFECDISEIMKIMHIMETIRVGSKIIIYAFPHQAPFYQEVFRERAEIRTMSIEQIVSEVL